METSNNVEFSGDMRAPDPEYDGLELLHELQRMSFGEFGQEKMREPSFSAEPEVRLIYAVLAEAVETLATAQGSKWREVERVIKWLRSRHEDWIFNFIPVCDALELDPAAVKVALERRYSYAWKLKEATRLIRQGKLGFEDIEARSGATIEDVLVIARGIMPPHVVKAKARGLRCQGQGSWLIDPVEPVSLSMSQNPDPSNSAYLTLDH